MEKISINMLSKADSVEGQGVGSAYLEQVKLITEGASDIFEVRINDWKDADIVHHHTIEPINYLKMKTSKGVNICYVHFLPETLDGSINLPKPAFEVFKKYLIDFYKSADYLVVVNPIFIPALEAYKIPRDKIMYIPNYVSKVDFFKKSKKDIENLRKEIGVTKNDFVVLGVGQVQTRKGVLDFVEVAKEMPETTFIWCGGFSFGAITDGYKELKKVFENPPANVKFLGIIPRDKMNDMYNIADVLFMPSYNELFPMSILEASNTEVPILLRDLELYENILFGNYLKGSSNEEFINQINLLKSKDKQYEEYSKKSKNISDFYSKENVLKIWKDFYLKIYQEDLCNHLVFLEKTNKEMDKIIAGKKRALIKGSNSKKSIYSSTKKGDLLYFVTKGNRYIECKALTKEVYKTDKLDPEKALEFLLKHQSDLNLSATKIKKYAHKKYLTLIKFDEVEVIEPLKRIECEYLNVDDWLNINKDIEKE